MHIHSNIVLFYLHVYVFFLYLIMLLIAKTFVAVIMAAERSQNESLPASASPNPAMASCRRKKNEQATFLEDLKDHIDEFIHASMDEHKTCFQKTIKKVFSTL